MKSSFCIWAARDDPSWTPSAVAWSTSLNKTSDKPLSTSKSPGVCTPVAPVRPKLKTKCSSKCPIGLVNLGNTCYANSLLQSLFFLPEIWSKIPSTFYNSSPFTKSFMTVTTFPRNNSIAVDPSFFLSQLGSLISKTKPISAIN